MRVGDVGWPSAVGVVVLGCWQAASAFRLVPTYVLPAPLAILDRLVRDWDLLAHHTWVTGLEIFLGFLVSALTGVLVAMMIVFSRRFEQAFYPWIVATQAIPKVALGPLIIIWFGFGMTPKILIVCLVSFFPVMISTVIGLRSLDRDSLFLMRTMGAGALKIFWFAQLPNGLPSLFGGLKVAIVLAAVGAIVGEFVGANEGLGYVLLAANGSLDTELLFAALVLIAVLSAAMYVVVQMAERVCIRWHVSVRHGEPGATA